MIRLYNRSLIMKQGLKKKIIPNNVTSLVFFAFFPP